MSNKSKTRSKEKRRKEKAARKAQMKAQYERWRDEGKNKKSFRARKAAAKVQLRARTHPHGICGNPGCERCYGIYFKAHLVDGQPHHMPHRMWKRWDMLSPEQKKKARKGERIQCQELVQEKVTADAQP